MARLIAFLVTFALAVGLLTAMPAPTEKYQHSSVLTPDEFAIFWNVTADSQWVLEIHCKVAGWMGFGLSLDKTQNDGDVFVIWGSENNDGTGHFSDRHRKNGGDLLVDKKQGWFMDLITFDSEYKYMIFKLHRKVRICDPDQEDLDIRTGLNNIVYLYGADFATDYVKPWNLREVDVLRGASEGDCQANPAPIVFESAPTAYYANFVDLIEGVYRFYWNFTDTDITGEIHCKTKGWLGFGLSPNGKMDKSDVVVGWIADDGHVNFTDRHVVGRSVLIDESQDWTLLGSKEENGFTVFKFTRKIVSCDPDDRIIETGSPHLIYAYGTSDPAPGADIQYHGLDNRGTRQALLISGATNKDQVVEGIETIDFMVENVLLPAADTVYYCHLMKVPDSFTKKRHIFKWELLMPKTNTERIHHVLVYECPLNLEITMNPNGNCYTNAVRAKCQTISFGWAVGAEFTHYFPEDTGYPIGGDTDYKYFYLEVHYDNPASKQGYIDSMGLRFHMTQNLRKNELGILTLGTGAGEYSISIPPGSERFELTTYCYKHCSQQLPSDITVILATPHTHLAGVGLSTKIIRDGKDIGYLHQNKYYDFNFQNVYRLDPPIVVKQGDELITKCVYNTEGRNRFTFGGEPTYQEMCYYFYTYYPRLSGYSDCLSFVDANSLASLFRDLARQNYTTMSSQASLDNNILIYEGTQQLKSKTSAPPAVHQAYERFLNTSQFQSYCGQIYDPTPRKPVVASNVYEEQNICKDTQTATQPTETMPSVTTTRLTVTTSAAARTTGPTALIYIVFSFIALVF